MSQLNFEPFLCGLRLELPDKALATRIPAVRFLAILRSTFLRKRPHLLIGRCSTAPNPSIDCFFRCPTGCRCLRKLPALVFVFPGPVRNRDFLHSTNRVLEAYP